MAKCRATGAVSGAVMAIFGGGSAEISHDKNANGGGEGAVGGFGLGDEGADLMHGKFFAPADIAEPIPHFRFQPDRGAVTINGYITAQKDAFGCYGGQAGSKHEKHHNWGGDTPYSCISYTTIGLSILNVGLFHLCAGYGFSASALVRALIVRA